MDSVGIAVAHPDDETLWAGGTLLRHPNWRCRIYTLCRASDADRAARFRRVLARYGAAGDMADLDDDPAQTPLDPTMVQETLLALLGPAPLDLLITHGPYGEYTWHQRHVEVCRAVLALWQAGRISARQLWLFAYEDGGGAYLPRACERAKIVRRLPREVWEEKYRIIHELYGFSATSWEARTTPRREAFWCFTSPEQVAAWLPRMPMVCKES